MGLDHNFYIKLFGIVSGSIFTVMKIYHRFMIKEIEKKVDKTIYEKELEFLKEQREDDRKALFKKIDKLEESITELNKNIIKLFTEKK